MKKCWTVIRNGGLDVTYQEGLIVADSYGRAMAKLEEYLNELCQGYVVRIDNSFCIYDENGNAQEDRYCLRSSETLKG